MTQKTIKKISALTAVAAISTTAFLPLGTTPVFAEESLWTLDDMIALSVEFEAELDEVCADSDDFMCKDMYIWQKTDPIYGALLGFQSSQLFVTSFNPSSGALKVYYNDVNFSTKHMGSSIYQYDLVNLYIVQYDRGYIDNYVSDLKNGIKRDQRRDLVYGSQAANGAGWLPAHTEIEFSALDFPGEKLLSNPKLHYTYETTSGLSAGDVANLEGCTKSPDYQDGMECQIRFSSSGLPSYIPVAVTNQNDGSDTTNIASVDTSNGVANATTTIATGLDSTTVTAPDTGEPTADKNGSSEFPWWAFVPTILGLITAIWFFWPQKPKKSKKSLKKS